MRKHVWLLGALIASLLLVTSAPRSHAQEASPEDPVQTDVIVPDAPPPTPLPPADPDPAVVQENTEAPPPPEPTAIPPNTDVFQAIEFSDVGTLQPGSSAVLAFGYLVTTPRNATTIAAEIRDANGQNGQWTVQLQAGGLWSDAGSHARITDMQVTTENSTIPLTVIVTAPQSVIATETISIWLSSSIVRIDGGLEQGVAAVQPVASLAVAPPPSTPTPVPTVAPLVEPMVSCTESAPYEAPVGGVFQFICEVTVLDGRAGANLKVQLSHGWTATAGDVEIPSTTLELGPFLISDGEPTVHSVAISIHAPNVMSPDGALTILLLQDTNPQIEFARTTIQVSTVVPEDWQLACSAGSLPIAPGTNAVISCELPAAAWEPRGDRPSFNHAADGTWASADNSSLVDRTFSFSLPIPCQVESEEERISVNVDLDNGITLTSTVTLSVNTRAAAPVPVLSNSPIDFAESQWLGTSYTPAEATVTLTVSGASSPCASATWSIQLNTTAFSNGDIEIDPLISFSTLESSGTAISPKSAGAVTPGTGATVVSGSGDSVVVLRLALLLPATVGAGTYSGNVAFSIFSGP